MTIARVAFVLSLVGVAAGGFALYRTMQEPVGVKHGVYSPGLGEFMTAIQMRHAKLGVAGAAQNWDLADYELGELDEAFEDVVTYHPTHEGVPKPLGEMVPSFTAAPRKEIKEAIAAKDLARFNTAFDALTAGCNGCHQTSQFGFNRVVRPSGPPVSNQDFSPQ